MKNTTLVLTSFVLLAAFAAPLHGQSLGEAARREAERRARIKGPTKVITNADLDALPSRGSLSAAASPASPSAVLEPRATQDPDDAAPKAAPPVDAPQVEQASAREKRDEQHWRERAQVIRERLNRLQSDAVALAGRVEGLHVEINAASGTQRAALTDQLRGAEATLMRVQGELLLIQGEWRQFEDRAVQAKIPSAWIR